MATKLELVTTKLVTGVNGSGLSSLISVQRREGIYTTDVSGPKIMGINTKSNLLKLSISFNKYPLCHEWKRTSVDQRGGLYSTILH